MKFWEASRCCFGWSTEEETSSFIHSRRTGRAELRMIEERMDHDGRLKDRMVPWSRLDWKLYHLFTASGQAGGWLKMSDGWVTSTSMSPKYRGPMKAESKGIDTLNLVVWKALHGPC